MALAPPGSLSQCVTPVSFPPQFHPLLLALVCGQSLLVETLNTTRAKSLVLFNRSNTYLFFNVFLIQTAQQILCQTNIWVCNVAFSISACYLPFQ